MKGEAVFLYHWTRPQNLIGIAASGLEPRPPYEETPHITAGKSVVWLTANPSRNVDPADADYVRRHEWTKPIMFGKPDDVRLTVKFNSTNRRKLHHYREWISRFEALTVTGEQYALADMLRILSPSGLRDYWVCLSPIPVSQIELPPITARVAMLGLKKDSEPYKQLAGVPPDTIVSVGTAGRGKSRKAA